MRTLGRGAGRGHPPAWVVMLGETEESLSLVAVTGTAQEAWALLHEAAETVPALTNEVSTVDYHPGGRRRGAIGPGERREVLVVEEAWPSDEQPVGFDVFESEESARAFARERASSRRVVRVVTNEWYGPMRRG